MLHIGKHQHMVLFNMTANNYDLVSIAQADTMMQIAELASRGSLLVEAKGLQVGLPPRRLV